jgi:hypothetical protein
MSSSGVNNNNNSGIRVSIDQSRARTTPKTDFGSVMKTGLSKGTDAVLSAGQLAAPYIPGGAIVSAAITSVGGLKSSQSAYGSGQAGGSNSTGLNVSGGAGGAGGAGGMGGAGGAMDPIAARAQGGDAQAQMMVATRQMQEMNMSFNMQYLQLQQKMQADNRQFTMLSNIMKTKHDTAKNAINNVR